MASIEELKKLADAEGVELSEEELELIAGGAYTYEEWYAMTVEERKAAQKRSFAKRILQMECELD